MSNTERKYANVIVENLFFDKIMEGLGVKKNYIGYYYVIEIIGLLINENMAVRSFSREVYPIIASRHGGSVGSIERDIRNFIDKNWSEEMRVGLFPFWTSSEKPTCCKFIFVVKSYILTKIA